MVGSSSVKAGNYLYLPAVLKPYNLRNSASDSGLITLTLESLSGSENEPSFFQPVSIMFLPLMNYKCTLVSDDQQVTNSGVENDDFPSGLSLTSFARNTFCSLFSKSVNIFNLRYSSHCSFAANNCTPLGLDVNYLPSIVTFSAIECSQDKQRLRALIKLSLSRD